MKLDVSKLLSAAREYGLTDCAALRLSVKLYTPRYEEARLRRIIRQGVLILVETLAENGEIAIVNSGMDCDCSAWSDSVSIVDATIQAVDSWVESFYASAEGPQSYYLERPSVAKLLRASSRDLALEAFENGHPHYISMADGDE